MQGTSLHFWTGQAHATELKEDVPERAKGGHGRLYHVGNFLDLVFLGEGKRKERKPSLPQRSKTTDEYRHFLLEVISCNLRLASILAKNLHLCVVFPDTVTAELWMGQ